MSTAAISPMSVSSQIHRRVPPFPDTATTSTTTATPPAAAAAPRSTAVAPITSTTVATGPTTKPETTSRAYPAIVTGAVIATSKAKKPSAVTTSTTSPASAGRVSLSPAGPSVHAAATKKKKEGSGVSAEVPIFLQKTYHMIDTCDPRICTWSEDGLTFVVRDTTLFETTIIPQFFKHNKFSSFVRQLNFYGFRKIKYSDSLRIDPQLEAQTANFWRFKHDKFRRGRKDLLIQIKRSGGGNAQSTAAASAQAQAHAAHAKVVPAAVASSAATSPAAAVPPPVPSRAADKPEEVTHLKTEVEELKEQIASMTKNIDELTSMVKNISVRDEEASSAKVEVGSKRKKSEEPRSDSDPLDLPMPDWSPSAPEVFGPADDATSLSPFSSLLDAPLPELVTSRNDSVSSASGISDDGFVDNLFRAFADDDASLEWNSTEELTPTATADRSPPPPTTTTPLPPPRSDNAPDPRVMKRIEDSLATLPKDMHELVADKLIEAISDARPIAEAAALTADESVVGAARAPLSSAVVDWDWDGDDDLDRDREHADTNDAPHTHEAPTIPLPLAVATLRTILAEYGVSVECHRADAAHVHRRMAKALPVVPVHA
ncbi:hypothetical protein ACHAXS_007232 [Conticribra weissflogii]